MFSWALHKIGWFMLRVAVTLACMWTIKNVAHHEGYYIDYHVLVVSAVCLIVGVRMWMPSCQCGGVSSKFHRS